MLPVLKSTGGDSQCGGEFGLRKTGARPSCRHVESVDFILRSPTAGFDVANGLQQFLADVAFRVACDLGTGREADVGTNATNWRSY